MYHESEKNKVNPPQKQEKQPGLQSKMTPKPISIYNDYRPSDKLKDKVVLVTGGDSGIGRAVSYHCVAEGAKVAFVYLNEAQDAKTTRQTIEDMGGDALDIKMDLSQRAGCCESVKRCLERFGDINILINNIAIQHPTKDIMDIKPDALQEVFATNVFSYIYMIQEALPHLKQGDSIINTTSITAFRGSAHLVDYSATKGAIVSLTRSLATLFQEQGIRVNAVAPGPVWTPLIPASFDADVVSEFGAQSPMKEPAQPADIAPCYVFLASHDSALITGQILHPNGGEVMA